MQAFDQLKKALMSAPALGLPDIFLKYQAIMVEQDDVEIVVTNTVNPASFLSGSMGEPVIHECLEAIEATYSSCPDLKDTLLENTETCSTDGSSCVISGRHAGDELNFSCTIIETPWIKEKKKKLERKRTMIAMHHDTETIRRVFKKVMFLTTEHYDANSSDTEIRSGTEQQEKRPLDLPEIEGEHPRCRACWVKWSWQADP
ncbi:hypothetical protein DUI87_30310 [Hirundo rustica rustica]|uniref:Uncharacterized protein n=1 Tax=Hirundo rustica rustica TaxID=333673 RepID=A0A3M0IXG9_HIRRU|nr:hypothetical protein DUI87_30310 [Hirundo rustica rustica]